MTNKTYAELLAQGGGGAAVGGWSRAFISSATLPAFTQAGTVVLSYASAGGGGGAANNTSGSATGGNSGPWGRKKFSVSVGDILAVNIAAGGRKAAANATNGSAGSTGTVTLNGATIMTIQGGEGGVYAAGTDTATAPTPTATITGADFVVPGIQAGSAAASTNANASGGAALDVLQTGLGRSPNISGPGGANTIGGSIGNNTGGIPQSWLLLAEWGIAITDPSAASTQNGAPGRGGISSSSIKPGIFAGSASSGGGPTQQAGGGSGGINAISGHNGGDAYAYMTFTPLA